ADPEGDGRGLDRLDVRLLPDGLGPDGAAAGGEDGAREHLLEILPARPVVAVEVRGPLDRFGGDGLAAAGQLDEGAHYVLAAPQRLLRAAQGRLVAAHM